MPADTRSAETGLGDSMSPGDITELALSDDIAFRVRFDGPGRRRRSATGAGRYCMISTGAPGGDGLGRRRTAPA